MSSNRGKRGSGAGGGGGLGRSLVKEKNKSKRSGRGEGSWVCITILNTCRLVIGACEAVYSTHTCGFFAFIEDNNLFESLYVLSILMCTDFMKFCSCT
jgi:hypothetical protein